MQRRLDEHALVASSLPRRPGGVRRSCNGVEGTVSFTNMSAHNAYLPPRRCQIPLHLTLPDQLTWRAAAPA